MRKLVCGISFAALAAFVSGCASEPESIQATNVNPAQYDYMTCAQIADYSQQLNATYKLASDQEEDARSEDALGYIILQQPLGQQRHPAIPGEIADLKGRLAALQSLETSKNCTTKQASLSPSDVTATR